MCVGGGTGLWEASCRAHSQGHRVHRQNLLDGANTQPVLGYCFRIRLRDRNLVPMWKYLTQALGRGIKEPGPNWECQTPTCKPCLAGISGCGSVFRAVNRYLAARPSGPRTGWVCPTLAGRKGGLQDSGVGLDCQTNGRARTPPSTVLLPPKQRKASF